MTDEELISLIADNVVNTYEATQLLGCSRQYVMKLVKSGKLRVVKELHQDRLYLKKDILARLKPSE